MGECSHYWVNDQVRVMTALRHPNVVLFMAACTKPPKMCIVMEFMSLGSLYDVRSPIELRDLTGYSHTINCSHSSL
jgi:serine/threonine protein kinase